LAAGARLADAGRGAGDEHDPGGHVRQTIGAVEVDDAIRTRRTHKAYGAEPVPRRTLEELFELARWAPNHNLTNPWRFRVLGPDALARLKDAAGPEAAAKLDRAPTLVAASQVRSADPVQDEEDLCAAATASYIVLLGAHARGLAGYWRTPAVLRTPEGRDALGVGADERVIGLIHLGPPRQEREAPGRLPPADFVRFLA
jgi:nitroreductase